MAATNYTPISLYYSATATNTPSAGNLVYGELAINIADGKLYYKNPSNVVTLLAVSGGAIAPITNNGVVYINGSGQAVSGSALTFDGTLFSNTQTALAGGVLANLSNTTNGSFLQFSAPGVANVRIGNPNADALAFYTFGAGAYPEQMRLTSTGLGIGTSSPGAKLDVRSLGTYTGEPQASFYDTRAVAASVGGGINFGGVYTGTTVTTWAGISGLKENATDGNFAGCLTFYTRPNGSGATEKMRLDSAGNLGLGVTPSAWFSTYKALQINTNGSLTTNTDFFAVSNNAYTNAAGNDIYLTTGYAARYRSVASSGQHQWSVAPSGTAGNAITFTQAMTLDASGNLTLGQTTSTARLTIQSGVANGTVAQFGGSSGGSDPRGLTIKTFSSNGGGDCGVDFNAAVNNTSYGSFKFSAGSATLATIDSSGNLLLQQTRSYNQSANIYLEIGGTDNGYVNNGATSSWRQYVAGDANGQSLRFDAFVRGTGFTERMRIDSSGNLLVGTTTDAATDSNSFILNPTTKQIAILHATGTSSGQNYINFLYAAGSIGSITQSGTAAVLYNVTSDQRLKENIVDAPEFGSVIDSLQVRSFDWKSDGNHQRAGFVAQELVAVAPEAVHQPADPEEMMAVDYSKLVPMLVKEIQSLRIRIAQLENKL
jgi:hypothetical protein